MFKIITSLKDITREVEDWIIEYYDEYYSLNRTEIIELISDCLYSNLIINGFRFGDDLNDYQEIIDDFEIDEILKEYEL